MYGKTKQQALEKLLELRHRANIGRLPVPNKQTVGSFLTNWLELKRFTYSGSTQALYAVLARKHIAPYIGADQLQRIDAARLRSFYAGRIASKVGIVTVRKVHALLHRAFADAVDEGTLVQNITERVSPPTVERKTRRHLTNEQIESLLTAAHGCRVEALLALAVFTGMREGELLGLQWDDIDFSTNTLSIKGALRRSRDGTVEIEPTKTLASSWRIALPQIAVSVLARHREAMALEKHGSTLVFCTTAGTPIHKSNLLRREYYPLLVKAGLPRITFHDLRHSAASALLALGTHPKIVQERLGHTDIRTTMNLYSHSIPTIQAEAARALDERFGSREP